MTKPKKSNPEKTGFANTLVAWYEKNHRDLPWRNTLDPYAIWLSEIMLQQTQVATVIPYYEKFLRLYPSVEDLANAPLDDVLKAWEGLGYYARCRNLHKAARIIADDYHGKFPDNIDDVTNLPGIGQSTAGAILTFGYGQRHPLLDGNVKRVLARLFDIDENPADTKVQKRMWECSTQLLAEAADPYSYNQGIMELGATLCTPQNPMCLVCPVGEFCTAVANGTQHERPVKTEKKPLPHHVIAVGVIRKGNDVLIQQRPNDGLLGGLWEFPGGKQEKDETLENTVLREIEEELGIQVVVKEKIIQVKHAYTHFKITLHAYFCDYVAGIPEPKAAQQWRWVPTEMLETYAFPKANKKVLEALLNPELSGEAENPAYTPTLSLR